MTELFDQQGRVSEQLQELWNRMNGIPTAEEFEQLQAEARANPDGFKTTCLWPGVEPGEMPSYRYWRSEPVRRNGQREQWCYASKRNIAGWFMGWRELVNEDGSGERDEWFSRRKKKDVIARCKRKAGVQL